MFLAALQAEFVEAEVQLAEWEHRAALARLEDRKRRERANLEAYRHARQRQLDELKSEFYVEGQCPKFAILFGCLSGNFGPKKECKIWWKMWNELDLCRKLR